LLGEVLKAGGRLLIFVVLSMVPAASLGIRGGSVKYRRGTRPIAVARAAFALSCPAIMV
jgi:hypothetical protein